MDFFDSYHLYEMKRAKQLKHVVRGNVFGDFLSNVTTELNFPVYIVSRDYRRSKFPFLVKMRSRN